MLSSKSYHERILIAYLPKSARTLLGKGLIVAVCVFFMFKRDVAWWMFGFPMEKPKFACEFQHETFWVP
jgi:hypothetical protein